MSPERRDRLFQSAAEEFAARGYEAASLNRIIERAGIAKSSLYYYFDDKRDLFEQLVQSVVERFVRDIGGFDYRTLTAETFWPAIEALFVKGVAFSERNMWSVHMGQLFYRLRTREKRDAAGGLMGLAGGWTAALLRHGMRLGVVRTDLPEGLLIQSVMALVEVCDRYFLETWDRYGQDERRALVAQQIELLKRVCLPVADAETLPVPKVARPPSAR
jgi:AcrR family transcriptional regulator